MAAMRRRIAYSLTWLVATCLAVALSWLRRKLGETAALPRYLHTIRGVGVRLRAP